MNALWSRCVFEKYKVEDPDSLHFFNYIYNVHKYCLGDYPNRYPKLDWECSANMASLNYGDAIGVSDCVYYSWKEELNYQSDNEMFY